MVGERRSALSIDAVELPARLTREQHSARFEFRSSARRRFDRLAATLETTVGSLRAEIPAATLGVAALDGRANLPLDIGLLPAGATTLTLAPIDRTGRPGTGASVSFDVPAGEAGPRPRLVDVRPVRDVLRCPGRRGDLVSIRLLMSAQAGGEPLVSVHVAALGPDGSESGVLLPPPAERSFEAAEMAVALLDSSAIPGIHEFRVTVIDAAGTTTEALPVGITLTDDDNAPGGPTVDVLEPSEAAAGDVVQVRGRGFDAGGLTVEIGSVVAPLLDVEPDEVAFAMPDIDRAGRVVVRTTDGIGHSEVELSPRVAVQIVPSEFEVSEGDEIQLVALVTGTADQRVSWTADPSRATVDPTGRMTATFAGKAERIRVTASAVAAPDSAGSAFGRVVPMPAREGPVAIGVNGGTVLDPTGGVRLTIPRGALAEPTTIELRHIPSGPDPDWSVAAGATIEPSGVELARPATLKVPLRVWHDPGSRLAVQHQVDPSDAWEDLEMRAVVDPTGFLARLAIARLGMFRLAKPFPMVPPPVPSDPFPRITGVLPATIEEGATAAFLVTGANFVPGYTHVIVWDFRQNSWAEHMEARAVAVSVDGTKLATTVKAGVMTDLPEGATRDYTLLVETPAGSDEGLITVLGRDELDVPSGTRTLATSRRFSRMDIGQSGTVVIANAHPPLVIEVNERATISASFTSGGSVITRGAAGSDGVAGDVPIAGGTGGPGGGGVGPPALGRGGDGGRGGTGASSPGSSGGVGGASLTQSGAGAGGSGGLGGGGDGTPGSGGQRGLAAAIPPIVEVGPGGGGGGGGGGEGLFPAQLGGGGGGGGAGGGAFRISAGEEIRLFGDVFALGGNGGLGAYPFTTTAIPPVPTMAAGRGAGGGGGAGGAIELSGVGPWATIVVAVGGQNAGVPPYDTAPPNVDTPLQTILKQPPTGVIRVDGTRPVTIPATAIRGPDLSYRYNLVSTSPQLVVSGFGAQQVRVLDRFGNVRTHLTTPTPDGAFDCAVNLFDGFNDVWADAFAGTGPPAMTNAAIRSRTVIYLANVASSYSFSCSITPAQVTVPTERSVTLSASVTASQPSPIAWGFMTTLGPGNGEILGLPGDQARYTAPCTAPNQPVIVGAASGLLPTYSCQAQVTVVPGVTLASTAALGTPADPAVPSANVNQAISITIPPAAFSATQQGFVAGDAATFRLIERSAGQCQESTVPIQGTAGVGMTSLQVTVPGCAHPDQHVRVPGHGCVRLLVVPTITSLDLDPAIAPGMLIKGTGFVCGATRITFAGVEVAVGSIISVTCGLIHLATRPSPGATIVVSTAGGTSNGVTS
jgi:hypothetical protein